MRRNETLLPEPLKGRTYEIDELGIISQIDAEQGTKKVMASPYLSPLEKEILTSLHGLDTHDGTSMNVEEIAARYGLRREQIRQLNKSALQKAAVILDPNAKNIG